ncbi:hypothetical protein UA08_00700 [Talaromyces atroroseus]|uniref:RNA-dependent RNA polymerase n=1 Tax=Talaromyces atroroseus TaxID=1441469 RepID=A0A225B811_TALAT|nr:hypothetical protein UA08_00700 [Talaromyces atroroseus]OKL64229.1 hypothetical protein UA08_00700 [Talaromyces atroroseus]
MGDYSSARTSGGPETPSGKTSGILEKEIEDLNNEFFLGIPNPKLQSPSTRPVIQRSKEEQCRVLIKELFWKNREGLNRALAGFREQVRPEIRDRNQRAHKPNQDHGTVPSREIFLRANGCRSNLADGERLKRLATLWGFLSSEIWIVREREDPLEAPSSTTLPIEVEYSSLGNLGEYDDPTWNEFNLNASTMERADVVKLADQKCGSPKKRQSKITEHMMITKPSQLNHQPPKNPGTPSTVRNDVSFALDGAAASPEISFATTVNSVFDRPEPSRNPGTSFETIITEPSDDTSTQADSIEGAMLSEEASILLKSLEGNTSMSIENALARRSLEEEILEDLLGNGPFAKTREEFSEKVPLRARYELERIRQDWEVEPKQILVGDKPYEKYSDFWQWLDEVGRRMNKTLPEKPLMKAWNSAIGRYQGDRHSEAVVLSGTLDWCNKDEAGMFKLRLNPLKIDRTCRFHRRFGSDRFLSIIIPSPSQPPKHIAIRNQTIVREILTKWLVNNDHYFLRRRWKAFYVDDYKTRSKSKSGQSRIRVEFFAVDGSDFTLKFHPPTLSPVGETCESHTRMTLDQLVQWHIPLDDNRDQTDCKLFNRIGLALSKTWATVVLQPDQIRKLLGPKGKPVMNDGCALMSRSLGQAICVELGIDGATPSCFQGRIAGAKGLWMVDRDQAGDDSFWIEISDSQLKIKPHPHDLSGYVDKEKVTFEVASWSKPLRPSELNTQLLEILDNRGQVRSRVAEIARTAIREVYMEFETVMEKNSIPLARALMQKIRPTPEDESSRTSLRRVDQWIAQNIESVIRFLEAGFTPREFRPLRDRMRICLSDTLNKYVDDLHIPIPLSTYAYCIADPYGILEEDEVHFAFSSQWRDCSSFEDVMVDGMDVLVGRTPAHCPWDIQRRKAVWRPGLRHFKDVIVFSTKGSTALASLLSGGDYDGDRPWICWDQGIVETFTNTNPPNFEHGPEHFGLVKHARPMNAINSVDELLESAFKFNLAPSNLGLCTTEHEKLAYEEMKGLSSPLSIELATLLSHLVDSKKSGLQLTSEQWRRYCKSLSPQERRKPAYKDPTAEKWNVRNINDYLRFEVGLREREEALARFNQMYGAEEDNWDEDLIRPWKAAFMRAEREKEEVEHRRPEVALSSTLYEVLKNVREHINQAYHKWTRGCSPHGTPIALKVQLAADLLNRIQPPDFNHPLAHTWQNSEFEWQILLASGAYFLRWRSAFPLYAAGETLCRIKTGKEPARLIRDQVYISMKVNSGRARRLAGAEAEDIADDEVESDGESEDFDRKSDIDALLEIGD